MATETASYRVTLWRTKKPSGSQTRLVTVDSDAEAVFVAQEWLCWSHEAGRGKRVKFEHYRVEQRSSDGVWTTISEGNVKDAATQVRKEAVPGTEKRSVPKRLIGDQGATRFRGRSRGTAGARPQSRLAALVSKIKSQT